MITFEELQETILKFGLKPASSREMSFFSFTCVSLGYTKFLKEILGFYYKSIGAFGQEGKWHSFFNESHIAESTRKFLKKHPNSFDKLALVPARRIFKESEKQFFQLKKNGNNIEKLKIIHDFYPKYFAAIGVYNCFWRYMGNNERPERLASSDIKMISDERNSTAKFYPMVEETIKECAIQIGKAERFDGDLLRYLTHSEMGLYLNGKLSIDIMTRELSARRKNYFYLYVKKENREEIITDKKIIEKILDKFYGVPVNIKIIKGFSACKGIAQGRVYNMQHRHSVLNASKKNFILVTSSTHPNDLALVKKCAAIITDEGGIISHAAIISRELKKPCIIGTKIATKVLKDGVKVEVNANTGIVKILSDA